MFKRGLCILSIAIVTFTLINLVVAQSEPNTNGSLRSLITPNMTSVNSTNQLNNSQPATQPVQQNQTITSVTSSESALPVPDVQVQVALDVNNSAYGSVPIDDAAVAEIVESIANATNAPTANPVVQNQNPIAVSGMITEDPAADYIPAIAVPTVQVEIVSLETQAAEPQTVTTQTVTTMSDETLSNDIVEGAVSENIAPEAQFAQVTESETADSVSSEVLQAGANVISPFTITNIVPDVAVAVKVQEAEIAAEVTEGIEEDNLDNFAEIEDEIVEGMLEVNQEGVNQDSEISEDVKSELLSEVLDNDLSDKLSDYYSDNESGSEILTKAQDSKNSVAGSSDKEAEINLPLADEKDDDETDSQQIGESDSEVETDTKLVKDKEFNEEADNAVSGDRTEETKVSLRDSLASAVEAPVSNVSDDVNSEDKENIEQDFVLPKEQEFESLDESNLDESELNKSTEEFFESLNRSIDKIEAAQKIARAKQDATNQDAVANLAPQALSADSNTLIEEARVDLEKRRQNAIAFINRGINDDEQDESENTEDIRNIGSSQNSDSFQGEPKTISTPASNIEVQLPFLLAQAPKGEVIPSPSGIEGELAEVRVEGVGDTLVDLVKINLNARVGTPVERIDLEAERNRVLSMGTFATVTVALEDRGNGPILFVRLLQNPPIDDIVIEGSRYPQNRLLEVLNERNLLRSGAIYNTLRAQEAIDTLQVGYKEQGWPFEIPVALDITEVPDSPMADPNLSLVPVKLTYTITEEIPLDEVQFEGNTVIDSEVLQEAFRPLASSETFDYDLYSLAQREIAKAYDEAGYRGSGIDAEATAFVDDDLIVRLRELRISSVNTTAIGVDPSVLSLNAGDLFNYDVLLNDVLVLSQGRTADIRLDYPITADGGVRVVFSSGAPDTAGPISQVNIVGNTVIPDEEIKAVLTLAVGETYTSEVARDDFRAIQRLYTEQGYALLGQPNFNFEEGVYTQTVDEIVISRYNVVFEEGKSRTKESVITRYLSPEGSVYNQNNIRNELIRVARLQVVEPVDVQPVFENDNDPSEATVNVLVREAQTRRFTPQVTYSTDSGLQASAKYNDQNFLGRAQDLGIEVTGQTSDNGLQFGGSLTWSVPWLYVDFLDFKETPTSLSVSVFSFVDINQPITSKGSRFVQHPCVAKGVCADVEENRALVGDFLERNTGLRFSVGRPIFKNTTIRVSASGSYNHYAFEKSSDPCAFYTGEDGLQYLSKKDCTLTEAEAEQYLPQSGAFVLVSTDLVYDNRNSGEFPARGWRATARAAVGLGSDYKNPETGQKAAYSYQSLEFGVSTYIAFSPDRDNHVLAFKFNVGQQFGGNYPTRRRFSVGNTTNSATQIRGYTRSDFDPSKTYAVGTAEYRYDFGLSTPITQTIVGVVFLDAGYASSVPGFDDKTPPLFVGGGLGVQINVGFGGALLAPVRLDYGFSQKNPSGVLSFRLGYVF